MTNILDSVELTRIYQEANGELHGKAKPISTARIFAAMQAAYDAGRASNRKLLEAVKKCEQLSTQLVGAAADGAEACAEELRRMAEGEE